jgi:hypothetical protein
LTSGVVEPEIHPVGELRRRLDLAGCRKQIREALLGGHQLSAR